MMNKRLQLVFEGPDCSGKTTQYQKIWKKIQSEYQKKNIHFHHT